MKEKYKIEEMAVEVKTIQKSAARLKKLSGGIQAVNKNADRILASAKMLEIDLGK